MEEYIRNRQGLALFCRIQGGGARTILLIHGASVDADFFTDLSALLSRRYRVISYDRRGYSRSQRAEECGLQAQADDAADLLRRMADGPAAVIGCSLGALAAMKLTEQYPQLVSDVLLHEPPLLCMGDVTPAEDAVWRETRRLVGEGAYRKALMRFLMLNNGAQDDRARPYTPEEIDLSLRNGTFFMEHEFLQQMFLEEEAYGIPRLREHGRVRCLVGDSGRAHFAARSTVLLAGRLGISPFYVPGEHNAARDLPAEFAAAVTGLLELGTDLTAPREGGRP